LNELAAKKAARKIAEASLHMGQTQ
jgi:hypothetical protein